MNKLTKIVPIILGVASLIACSDNDNNMAVPEEPTPVPAPAEYSYRLTVLNLTHNQPLSPLAFALHQTSYRPWTIGMAASSGLEILAEGGATTDFLNDPEIMAGLAGDGIIKPGMSQSVELTVSQRDNLMFSAATMLVNTNDAFTGLNARDIASLELGESLMMTGPVYDSGTEKNTESSGTMPGPADNGTGFDATQDDVGFVTMHAGVVSQDDGLTNSVLDQSHRFDSTVAKFTIERIK